jgi:hypothetical protein
MEKKGLIGLMVLAILAATIGTAEDATASVPGVGAAKKKCKKPHAKKRCKKKGRRRADAPQLPVIRATLTWFNQDARDVDADLFVFDASGNRAGNGSNTIPLSSLTGDVSGSAGSETFTDGLFTPQAVRDLSFGVCYSGRGPAPTNLTITYVTADGGIHGDSQRPRLDSHFDYPGGAPIPDDYCPGTNLVP